MATANLNVSEVQIVDSLDGIVVINALSEIPGGRTLDVSGWTDSVVKAGNVIVRDTENDVYKPLGISAGAYTTIAAKHEYVGVLKFAVAVNDPRAAIVLQGVVNEAASPAPVTDAIKAALPGIKWLHGKANAE